MSDVRLADDSPTPFQSAVASFEAAWQSGTAPSLETFLSARGPLGAAAASDADLARELVLVDLEFRWRKLPEAADAASCGTLPPHPRAEDYVRIFPQLFHEPARVAELVAEEYLVRHRWGDHPPLAELLGRFPGRTDVVIAAEQAVKNLAEATSVHRSNVAPLAAPPREAADPAEGTHWGRYVIAQLLGSGKFGSVYRCYDPQLNRFVALKIVRATPYGGDHRTAVLREARAAAAIRHPNVVAVFDVIENAAGEIGIVTEFVAGEALEQHLGRGEPDLFEALRWVAATAEAVHEAHTVGVVHRDLKPANILIDTAGRPRVTDFGLALLLTERAAAAGEVAGTPRYMSPEQLRGETKRLDGRSDVWSLGIILYRLLTGRFPFPATDAQALFRAIEHDVPDPPRKWNAHLPPQLEGICLACLEKDPRRRFATALELATALRSFERKSGRAAGDDVAQSMPASPEVGGDGAGWSSLHRQAAGNLPRAAGEIVGRKADLARIEQALAAPDVWLVTLCGPGGVGKTRLALEAARRMKPPPGGIWWVDWSAARDAGAAAQAVLAALHSRLPERTAPDEHVSQVLSCLPPPVLVLDNAEQVIDAAADLVRRWGERNPHVCFLVTSRERLHLPGERVIELEPLPVPADDADPAASESVQLFVRRAGELDAAQTFGAEQLRLAGSICRALEGLPLAIELAARRTNVLSLAEIAAALNDRLVSFKAGPHERPDRQQTLLAAVAWSFDLLTPAERTTLVHLSRFAGGFTRDTAAAMLAALPTFVGGEFTDLLQSLREKSLLRVGAAPYGRRFSMLEMVREYADRLRAVTSDAATEAALDERLATALPAELAGLRPQLNTASAAVVLRRYADEAENLARVEQWARQAGRPDAALRAMLPLVDAIPLRGAAADLVDRMRVAVGQLGAEQRTSIIRGRLALARVLRHEGRWHEALDEARAAAAETIFATDAALEGEALRLVAEMQRRLGAPSDAEAALRRAEDAVRSAEPVEQALCHVEWAVLLAQRGRVAEAQARLDRAAALLTGGVAPPLEAEVERRRGQLLLQAGEPTRALGCLERAEAAARTAGDLRALQLTLSSRGTVYTDLGRYDQALADFAEAERLARRLGDRRGLAVVWGNRAIALADLGDLVAALESFRRAEQFNRMIDAKFGVAANLAGQANVHALEGNFNAAAAAFDEAARLAEASGFEFLAAVIQGDRGVARFLANEHGAAREDLAQAIARLEAGGSPATHEVFCFAAFAAAAEQALGNATAAAEFAGRARRLADAGVVSRDSTKPRVRHAFRLLN